MPAGLPALDIRHWFLLRTAQISVLTSSSRPTYRLTGNVWTTEGPAYQRVVTLVRTSTGYVDASIYVLVEAMVED